jgi:hypothetical protein
MTNGLLRKTVIFVKISHYKKRVKHEKNNFINVSEFFSIC